MILLLRPFKKTMKLDILLCSEKFHHILSNLNICFSYNVWMMKKKDDQHTDQLKIGEALI